MRLLNKSGPTRQDRFPKLSLSASYSGGNTLWTIRYASSINYVGGLKTGVANLYSLSRSQAPGIVCASAWLHPLCSRLAGRGDQRRTLKTSPAEWEPPWSCAYYTGKRVLVWKTRRGENDLFISDWLCNIKSNLRGGRVDEVCGGGVGRVAGRTGGGGWRGWEIRVSDGDGPISSANTK